MSLSRKERLKELVARAGELPPAQREAFIERECGNDPALKAELSSLLDSLDSSPDVLERPPIRLAEQTDQEALKARLGQRLGCYRIEALLGVGGMGAVYRARRDDGVFEQTVAIKLLRHAGGGDLVRRFTQERATLASLNHPGITTLFDAGLDENGVPYLVMEYVDGLPIDVYCARRRLGLRERLRLVIQVCEALGHAHRHLVVHRDLKPSNILVTDEGRPKLVDFGIAKLLTEGSDDTLTRYGQPLTPEYASPEQFRGENITTATDVYGMGIVLYELLAGVRPFRSSSRSAYALSRTVCETNPPRPSTAVWEAPADSGPFATPADRRRWSRQLRGDLDAIVERALRKEPERRYASVEHLAEDLERWLEGRPVRARRGTLTYRLVKTLRRHRGTAIAASAAFMALLAGTAGTAYEAWRFSQQRDAAQRAEQRARDEADRAQREAQVARRVTDLLVDLFQVSDPEVGRGADLRAKDLLERGEQRLREGLRDEPSVRATLLDALGRVYENLGEYDRAAVLMEEALRIKRREYGPESLEVAASLNNLGLVRQEQGDLDEALRLQQEALRLRTALLSPDSAEVIQSRHNLAFVYQEMGRLADAERLLRDVLPARRRMFGEVSQEVVATMNNLAMVQFGQRRLDEARQTLEALLPITRQLLGDDHPQVALVLNNLGLVLHTSGDLEKAEEFYEKALEIRQACYPPEHPQMANAYNNLGGLAFDRGRYDQAAEWFQKALTVQAAVTGEDHPMSQRIRRNLARALLALERFDQAGPLLERAAAGLEKAFGPKHPETITTLLIQADLLSATGRADSAENLLRTVVDRIDPQVNPLTWCEAQLRRARVLETLGRHAEVAACARQVLEQLASRPNPPETLKAEAEALLDGAKSKADHDPS